jgi:hypothetical protein
MLVNNKGTIILFTPTSDEEKKWLEENTCSEPYQWQGASLCVEHRFAVDIQAGLHEAGFSLEVAR